MIADCRDGNIILSPRVRLGEEIEGAVREMGVSGRGGVEEGEDELVASEFRDLAFPLLYIPGGTDRFRSIGSWSTVGILGRSE